MIEFLYHPVSKPFNGPGVVFWRRRGCGFAEEGSISVVEGKGKHFVVFIYVRVDEK